LAESGGAAGSGRLFVVATPIGNLGDATPRSIDVLKAVDVIAAEDTRHTRKLLSHFGISTSLLAFHDHNEDRAPGYRLVTACAARGIEVVTVPGPCALVAALSIAGLPPHPFYFAGYLPRKGGQRRTRLSSLAEMPCTVVYYESPHRIASTLRDMRDVLGDRRAVVARELTKVHEEVLRGTLAELAELADSRNLKGEIVVVVAGPDQ